MASRSLGHRAPLLWLAVPFAAGHVLGRFVDGLQPSGWLFGAGLAALGAMISAARGGRGSWAVGIGAAMTMAGMASFSLHRPTPAGHWERRPPREALLSLRIERLFPKADPHKLAGLGTIVRAPLPLRECVGRPLYFSFTQQTAGAASARGTIVAVNGIFSAVPRDPPLNSFDGYLASAGIDFRLARGRLRAVEQPAPPYYRFCARALSRLSALLGAGVESKRPELVGVFRAMLLGQQQELSDEQTTRFRQSGTMHVFSISGLHIAVIAAATNALLALLRLPRWVRLAVGLAALWLYVDLTGGAPSAIRAFVMVAFVQLGLAWRVARNPLSSLTLSALLVLLTAPLAFFSASFQMSYGIVAALLLLGLPLADAWQEKWGLFHDFPKASWTWHHRARDQAWRAILGTVALGLSTALVGALTGPQFFNLFTPGALLANMWLIPASTLVILCGFVSLLGGLAGLAALGGLANHAAVLTLWLIDRGVRWNLQVPGMWIEAKFRVPALGGASLTLLLAALFAGYAAGWRGWARGYWPPFAVAVLVMAFGVKYGA